MYSRIVLYLCILMLGLLIVSEVKGQTLVDTLNVKPNTEVTLNFDYDLPGSAAFNDVLAYRGEIIWPETDGFAMTYVDGSYALGNIFDEFTNVINENEVKFHKLILAGASETGVKVDRDTTFISLTFITPDTFSPVYVTVISTFTLNESPTVYTHLYTIHVDPNIGISVEKELPDATLVNLYPNPTDGTLVNLDLDASFSGYVSADVFNVIGQELQPVITETLFYSGS